jgi:hypothetical protein
MTVPSGSAIAMERVPAGLGRRIKALLLTGLLVVVTLGVGWLVWSVVEWRRGRTASFRLTGLRVVRRSDGRPIGLVRSILRNAICCTLLLVPTIVACCVLALVFVMGASPPDHLLREPRPAPWDLLTRTEVVSERPVTVTEPVRAVESAGNGKGSISRL